MNTSKRILLLHAGDSGQGQLGGLAMALTHMGSSVTVKNLECGDYDHILDAVALADTVVYWPGESTE